MQCYARSAATSTRVLDTFYFRLQISTSGCSFCSQSMNCWNLWKLGASRFHLQLASLLFSNFAWGSALDQRATRYILGQRSTKAKALIKYQVNNHACC